MYELYACHMVLPFYELKLVKKLLPTLPSAEMWGCRRHFIKRQAVKDSSVVIHFAPKSTAFSDKSGKVQQGPTSSLLS